MKATRTIQEGVTQFVQGTAPAESQRAEPQNWSQFWPADLETQTGSDALTLEILTGLEKEGTIQDRLAGYRSESQGE